MNQVKPESASGCAVYCLGVCSLECVIASASGVVGAVTGTAIETAIGYAEDS
ncbi:hypothetical protein [Clostridium sp.]|uniref:hypothetical protein n=1 Tax=Clostridium sp. TaxID=1506 RepID=UPI0035A09110